MAKICEYAGRPAGDANITFLRCPEIPAAGVLTHGLAFEPDKLIEDVLVRISGQAYLRYVLVFDMVLTNLPVRDNRSATLIKCLV